jgi:hypothetical protein
MHWNGENERYDKAATSRIGKAKGRIKGKRKHKTQKQKD